ncbi:hypothetical protein [Paenibacillus sp. BT-177]|uniref:hypothetical protein n=1 Tax=Paenibacillus sp. BT-177 TaxID=2986930 RepID=UPI0021F7F5DA|nr:hypothetical protein [Paenibacillus sp. BT-177]
MKLFIIRKGVKLTLTDILAGTLAYGTVHAEGQTAKKIVPYETSNIRISIWQIFNTIPTYLPL